jgi:hypothetical protein
MDSREEDNFGRIPIMMIDPTAFLDDFPDAFLDTRRL